jgi:hypothetical protein
MNNNSQHSQQLQQQAAAEPDNPGTSTTAPDLTITKSQLAAGEFLKSLNELSAALPFPPVGEAVLRGGNLPDIHVNGGFLAAAVAAVADSPELQAINVLDVDQGRETLQVLDAWTPVLTTVMGIERRLRFALNSRKSPLGGKARTAYAVARGLTKRDPHSQLAVHVQAMKAAAGLGRRRKEGTGQKGN